MNAFLLLFLSIAFASGNNLIFRGFKNKGLRGMGDIFLFNAFISVIWTAILFILNGGSAISKASAIWGICYGMVMAVFLLCKMQAMSTGPASITSFFGCSSLLLSTAFGVLFFEEKISLIQIVGIAVLIFSLFLILTNKKAEKIQRKNKIWFLWCLGFFLASGATGIIFKMHQASSECAYVNQMLLCAAVTSAILFFALSFAMQYTAGGGLPKIPKNAVIFLIGCGFASCIYNRLNITLSGLLPSIIFFPVFNGSVIILTSILARILFKEKISRRQNVGMIIGVVSLIVTAVG